MTRTQWEAERDKVLDALADGHPNPEGYLEYWHSKNPMPDADRVSGLGTAKRCKYCGNYYDKPECTKCAKTP